MNYHNITYPDQNNGDGLRVVLWCAGCSHHCYNCQNPQTWDKNSGIIFDNNAKNELFNELSKDYISGITFSGGDPLYEDNISEILSLITEIKTNFPNKTIWLHTGYTWEKLQNEFDFYKYTPFSDSYDFWLSRLETISMCDVIVDGQFVDELKDLTLKWRGSSNQRVIDVKKSLDQNKVVLYCD